MGSDQPAGSALRLSRKFIFSPPPSKMTGAAPPPTTAAYAAASDLSSGVRVVAVYGEDIVSFSVPADAYAYSRAEQEETLVEPFDAKADAVALLRHPLSNRRAIVENNTAQSRTVEEFEQLNMVWSRWSQTSGESGVWPMRIAGRRVGGMTGVTALAIQVEGSRTPCVQIWAFGKSGEAKTWRY